MTNTMFIITNNTNGKSYMPFASEKKAEVLQLFEMGGVEVCASYEVGEMPLEALPEDVQNKVRMILRAYHKVNVTFEHGSFSVSTGICIKSKYGVDYFPCGDYTDTEVYTVEERRQNYREEFGSEPRF